MDFNIIASKDSVKLDILKKNSYSDIHPFYYEYCTINRGGFIMLDFGKEICGKLHILFNTNLEDGLINVRLGESVYEASSKIGHKNAGNYHSLRDMTYPVLSFSEFTSCETGFRFVRLECVEGSIGINISKIFAEEYDNGLSVKGDFKCSDGKINDIFNVAQRTISLCVRKDDIWDGVKRDRVLWIGDYYPELIASFYTYGIIPQHKTVLKKILCNNNSWINSIPSYSAWWIICLSKYYCLSGDICFVREMIETVKKIIGNFSDIVMDNGEVDFSKSDLNYFKDNEFFIDWPTNFTNDSKYGWRYLVIIALNSAIKLYNILNIDTSLPRKLIASLKQYNYCESSFKQVTALGIISKVIDGSRGKTIMSDNCLSGMTCFMSFAITDALKQVGEGDKALFVIKEYYGKMIELGATTFWEDFDLNWIKDNPDGITDFPDENKKNIHADFGKFCYKQLRMSLCHGWSTGFIDLFYSYVLGVIPVSPGYDTIKIEPHLCGLEYAEGKIPTIHGVIYVKHTIKNGKIETECEIPEGVKVV